MRHGFGHHRFLKNDADDHLKDCGWAKDDINRLREEEGGMLHFDALILGGCKFYCLRKKGCEDIAKLKGFKKSKGEELAFEDFELMAGGGEKTQKQVQFLCPKMNHLSVDEKFSCAPPRSLRSSVFYTIRVSSTMTAPSQVFIINFRFPSTLLRPAVPCLNFAFLRELKGT